MVMVMVMIINIADIDETIESVNVEHIMISVAQ
jgi:hypothetical protein